MARKRNNRDQQSQNQTGTGTATLDQLAQAAVEEARAQEQGTSAAHAFVQKYFSMIDGKPAEGFVATMDEFGAFEHPETTEGEPPAGAESEPQPEPAKAVKQAEAIVEQAQRERKVTGIKEVPMPEAEKAFRERFLAELTKLAKEKGRKTTQVEQVTVFMELKQADRTCPSSKLVILAQTLASYHGWASNMCGLRKDKYSYKAGLEKDRDWKPVEPAIMEWLAK